jgi:hypothetical protein
MIRCEKPADSCRQVSRIGGEQERLCELPFPAESEPGVSGSDSVRKKEPTDMELSP